MKARCGWCGNGFTKVDAAWWCRTRACQQRQADYALHIGGHPFYVPLPKQIDFELAPVRFLLGGGAAGASKSHMARYGLYRRALAIPGFEGLILRRTWDELKKHHLRLMEMEAAKLAARGLDAEYARTDREFRLRFPTGETSIIEGGHMEEPADVQKYLSRERDAIVLDEGATFDPETLLELSTRARSAKPAVLAFARHLWRRPVGPIPGGGAVFWVLSNPGGPAAPLLRDFFIDKTPNFDDYPQLRDCDSEGRPLYDPLEWAYIPGNLEDNPYLPESYERDLAVLPPWRYQQLRFNSWDVIAGQFFSEFDARLHVKDLGTPKGDVRWFRSYDYGYVHKGVCLWWAVLPDGRIYIRHEYVHRFLPILDIATQIRQQTIALRIPRVSYTVGDKFSLGMRNKDDAGETRRDIFEQMGIPMDGTSHDREQGWTRCRELLALRPDGQPWVVLHPSCRQLIRELAAAVSDDRHPEDIDEHCDQDALAAFRYGAMSRPSPLAPRRSGLSKRAAGYDLRVLQSTLAGRRRRAFA